MIARKISLISGVYLFVFVFAHLLNHSLGLISVQAMHDAQSWLLAPWNTDIGGWLLSASLLIHFFLGMRALYRRNTLRLSQFDWFQLLLGLSIPVLMLPHIITASLLPTIGDMHLTYEGVLKLMWITNPWLGLQQVLGLLVVWLHGCMGLFIWLRMQSWWGRVALLVYPTVVLLPTLALLGFVEAGKSVIADHANGSESSYSSSYSGGSYTDSGYGDYSSTDDYSNNSSGGYGYGNDDASGYGTDSAAADKYYFSADIDSALEKWISYSLLGYFAVLVLTLLARQIRVSGRGAMVAVHFEGEPVVHNRAGMTVLEISRMNDIGHASLCGGKGRCGTCQVRVLDGAGHLTSMTDIERTKLRQIGAQDDIRLACQARVQGGDIRLQHVLPGYVQAQDMPVAQPVSAAGGEQG